MSIRSLAAILTAGLLYSAVSNGQMLYGSTNANAIFSMGSDSMSNDLLVYPNPVSSSAKVVLNEASTGTVYVDIIDMNGRVDRSYQYVPGSDVLTVDMSKLPLGWYSLRVSGKGIGGHNIEVVKQ